MFRFLVLIAGLVAAAHAFGTGAPPSENVCKNLTPKHGVDPQTGTSPFKISLNKHVVGPGGEIEVTMEGTTGEEFKGFILQGRVGKDIVGSFKVDPAYSDRVQTLDCLDGKANAVTHRNPEKKQKISANWVAPQDLLEAKVVFIGSFVKEGELFWVKQQSAGVTVHH